MCGIVGYVGDQNAEPILYEGLTKLEYRGYDSAGIATLKEGRTERCRAVGKLVNLRSALAETPCPGSIGIGHTRWATHGAPTLDNAHPHHVDGVTVVHNGIIENHASLRADLIQSGSHFASHTDTEIFAHLISKARQSGMSLLDSLRDALKRIEGAYAIAVVDESVPGQIAFARLASPLVIGHAEDAHHLASDIPAVLNYTRRFTFLEDGDHGLLFQDRSEIYDANDDSVERPVKVIDWSPVMAEKGGHKHFMHKEIFEQPRAITDTLRGRIQSSDKKVNLEGIDLDALASCERLVIVACGTSYHAGMTGRYRLEALTRIPTQVELASEFRYRKPILDSKCAVLAISQSGETADTLAALQEAERLGAPRIGITNVIDSAVARHCDQSLGTLYTRAGPEIGVASTKAFTTQLVALDLLALALAQHESRSGLDGVQSQAGVDLAEALLRLPRDIEALLDNEDDVLKVARDFLKHDHMLYLGRQAMFPIALEGALKLKEISYIHAEGYAAGEMKHGPIALIDETMPVVVIAPRGEGYEKVVSNLEEVRARGGKIIALCDDDDVELKNLSEASLMLPKASALMRPVLATIPLQLFAYHIADLRGTDVDQPRNLAKSVTVE